MDRLKNWNISAVDTRAERRDLCLDDDQEEAAVDAGMVQPIAVLARIPNLGSGSSDVAAAAPESVGTYRLLSQSMSFRLLAGTMIVMLVAAIAPYVIGKLKSSSGSSTAGDQHAARQSEAPAPMADMAPAWNPPGAVAPSETAGGTMASTAAPTPVAHESKPANPGTTGGPQNATAASVVDAKPAAVVRAPVRVAEAVRSAPPTAPGPLDWQSFSRQFDQQSASSPAPRGCAAASAPAAGTPSVQLPATGSSVPPVNSSPNSSMILNQGMTGAINPWAPPSATASATLPRAAAPSSTYPATNTPNPLTVGPSIAGPSGNDQPVYSFRKQP